MIEPLNDLNKIVEQYITDYDSKDYYRYNINDFIFCYKTDISIFNRLILQYKQCKAFDVFVSDNQYSEDDILIIIKIAELLNVHIQLELEDNLMDIYYLNGGHKYTPMPIQTAFRLNIISENWYIFANYETIHHEDDCNHIDIFLDSLSDTEQYRFVLWAMNDKLNYNRITFLSGLIYSSKFTLVELYHNYLVECKNSELLTNSYEIDIYNFKDIDINELVQLYFYSKFILIINCYNNSDKALEAYFKKIFDFIDIAKHITKHDKFNFGTYPGRYHEFNEYVNCVFEFDVHYMKGYADNNSIILTPLGEKLVEKLKIAIKTGFNFASSFIHSTQICAELQKMCQ